MKYLTVCFLLLFANLFCTPEYKHLREVSFFSSVSIHTLEVDPALYEIRPAHALDDGIGKEPVLSLSERYRACAAVNGSFFFRAGNAAGALKIHDWIALPFKLRGCIGWSRAVSPLFDRLEVRITGEGSHAFELNGLNRTRADHEVVLFTPAFHRTTLTLPCGEEVVIRKNRITEIRKGGSSPIPSDGVVLSIGNKNPLYDTFCLGETVTFHTVVEPQLEKEDTERWHACDYIVSGVPLLIRHGSPIRDFDVEKARPQFLHGRHARTAIGILPNGHFLFVVVDKPTLLY